MSKTSEGSPSSTNDESAALEPYTVDSTEEQKDDANENLRQSFEDVIDYLINNPEDAERFMSGLRETLNKNKMQDQEPQPLGMGSTKPDNQSNNATYVDDTPTEKIDLKTYEAATNLKIARSRFAKASIAVESHFFKRKKRQEELNAATEELKQSELEYMRLKFADKIEAAKQDPEKQAELAAEMGQAALASMQETSRTTTDKYDDMLDDRNIFKKAAAKVGKWFNKGGRIAQWLKPGGAGFVAGTATGFFA